MLVSDEADAFDGMDRKAAEIALYEMGGQGEMVVLGIKHHRESRSEGGRSRPTLGPLQKVRGGGTGCSSYPNEVQCSEVVPTGEVGTHGLSRRSSQAVCLPSSHDVSSLVVRPPSLLATSYPSNGPGLSVVVGGYGDGWKGTCCSRLRAA